MVIATLEKMSNVPVLIPDRKKKSTQIFIFTLLYVASKGIIKAIKDFIKPFEAPQVREV